MAYLVLAERVADATKNRQLISMWADAQRESSDERVEIPTIEEALTDFDAVLNTDVEDQQSLANTVENRVKLAQAIRGW